MRIYQIDGAPQSYEYAIDVFGRTIELGSIDGLGFWCGKCLHDESHDECEDSDGIYVATSGTSYSPPSKDWAIPIPSWLAIAIVKGK